MRCCYCSPCVVRLRSRSEKLWLPKIVSGLGYPRFGMLDPLKLLSGLLVGLFRWPVAREALMPDSRYRRSAASEPAGPAFRSPAQPALLYGRSYGELCPELEDINDTCPCPALNSAP